MAWLAMADWPGVGRIVTVPVLDGLVLWLLLALIATHFGVSYHLAYGLGRRGVSEHRLALVVVPLALLALAAVVVVSLSSGAGQVGRGGARLALVAVYTLTTWHYVKQTYGVARLGATLRGTTIAPWEAKALQYGLYPLWLADAATVWSRDHRANDYGFDASFAILPAGTVEAMRATTAVTAVVVAVALAAMAHRHRSFPAATTWTPYAVAFLWIGLQPGHLSAVVVLGAVHALQYLACAHRAEVAWGAQRGEAQPKLWWCSVFGGALAAGMLLTYWVPTWLGVAGGQALGVGLAAMIFVVLNLHHYAIDATIWRSRSDHVKRIVGSYSPTVAPVSPCPGPWRSPRR